MKKTIIYLLVFIFTLVSNKAVSQSATANAIATIKIAEPFTIIKNVDLNFGTVSASTQTGTIILSTDGTTIVYGGAIIIDSSLITAASFGVFGPANSMFNITLPSYVELRNELNASMPLFEIKSNPNGTGTLDSTGKATVLVGASITVNASQAPGVYQGDIEVTVNLN